MFNFDHICESYGGDDGESVSCESDDMQCGSGELGKKYFKKVKLSQMKNSLKLNQ